MYTLLDKNPWIRKLLGYVPNRFHKKLIMSQYAGGVKIDASTGKILRVLRGDMSKIKFITTIL
jgi:hypothetical protein